MLSAAALLLLPALLASTAALPSAVIVIVPPNSTVVSEEVSFGASFAPDTDPGASASATYGYSTRIQLALTHPNGTQTAPSTVLDHACSDTPPAALGGFNSGGLNFSERVVPDAPGVYTIDVSVRFGFPPAGSTCADGKEEFQFRNSTASFQAQPLPAGASPTILIGTAFGLVTQTFAQPTGGVKGLGPGVDAGAGTGAGVGGTGTTAGAGGAATGTGAGTGVNTATGASTPVPTGGARAMGVPVALAAACAGGALVLSVSMW